MGGGKRKYNQKIRFRRFHKPEHAAFSDEKKEPPKEEDVRSLLDMWQNVKKKPQIAEDQSKQG